MPTATAFNLKSKDFIVKGLNALKSACDEGTFDADSLDLSECNKHERNALMAFLAKNKKLHTFPKLKEAFKSHCLGTVIVKAEPTKEKLIPKSAKVAKVVTKEKKSEKTTPKEVVKLNGGNAPLVFLKMDTEQGITLSDSEVLLCGVKLMNYHSELRKRQDAYELTFTWKLWSGAVMKDVVMLPTRMIDKKHKADYHIKRIAMQLVLCYLCPPDHQTMPHPADSQGDLNNPDRAVSK